MSEKTTEVGKAAQEVAEVVQDQMSAYFDAAKAIMEQYGGDVVNLGLNVLRIEAASELITPLCFFLISSVTLFIGRKIHKSIDKEKEKCKEENKHFDDGIYGAPAIFYGVGTLVGVISTIALIDLWAWVGIFYPELYAVHKFLL